MANEVKRSTEYPNYFVDESGNVWSTTPWRGQKSRVMKSRVGKTGYLEIRLRLAHGFKKVRVHRIVCAAFHGPRPNPKAVVRHLNGNRVDNRAINLRWGTPKENAEDREFHGRTFRGSKNHFAKLAEKDIPEVRRLRALGLTYSAISMRFGVSLYSIYRVIKGISWTHV